MKLLLGQDALVGEWILRRIPHMHGVAWDKFVAVGVIDEDDNMLGGVAYHNFQPAYRSIEWSAASDGANWLSRAIINDILRYPFEQMGCVRLTAVIPRKNVKARTFHSKFGFKQEGNVRRGFGGDDAIIYGLMASEWRKSPLNLKREKHGQERTGGAAADRPH